MAKPLLSCDTGAVAAEFAVVLPSVVLILLFSIALIRSQIQDAVLEQDAAIAARAIGRGEPESAVRRWLEHNLGEVDFSHTQADGVLCVNLKQRLRVGIKLPSLQASERSCVWVGQVVSL